MGARLRVGDQEPIGQALRRFRRLVARRDSFEKWYRRARRAGTYIKPSEIRSFKKRVHEARKAKWAALLAERRRDLPQRLRT
jgi:ribosomal protein S21